MQQQKQHPITLAVTCVDWRMHHPESNFMKELYRYTGAEKIYIVTYPGPDGLHGKADQAEQFTATVEQTREVLKEHGATNVRKVIVGHSQCAGHQVGDDSHCSDSAEMAAYLTEKLSCEVPFEPLLAEKPEPGNDYLWNIKSL